MLQNFNMSNFLDKDKPCVYPFWRSRRNGFSLLEVLISVAIFLIIASAMFALLTSGKKAFDMGAAQIDVEQEARRALDYISKELRQSSDSKISGVAPGASGNTIIFEIPYDIGSDGDVIDDATGGIEWSNDAGGIGTITYTYVGLDKQIVRTLSVSGAQTVLANEISSLSFTRPLAADTVAINVIAEKYPFKGFTGPSDEKVTVNLNTQVTLRN